MIQLKRHTVGCQHFCHAIGDRKELTAHAQLQTMPTVANGDALIQKLNKILCRLDQVFRNQLCKSVEGPLSIFKPLDILVNVLCDILSVASLGGAVQDLPHNSTNRTFISFITSM